MMLKLVQGTQISFGKNYTPSGESYVGLKVTIGGIDDPSKVERTYDDVEKIFKSNQTNFKTHEVRTSQGTFKSYTVET